MSEEQPTLTIGPWEFNDSDGMWYRKIIGGEWGGRDIAWMIPIDEEAETEIPYPFRSKFDLRDAHVAVINKDDSIAAAMEYLDKHLKNSGFTLDGGLPSKYSYLATPQDKEPPVSNEETQESTGRHATLAAMGRAMTEGAKLATAKEINDTCLDFIQFMMGDHYPTFMQTDLGQRAARGGAVVIVHFVAESAPGMFMGQAKNVQVACEYAMTAEAYDAMAPLLGKFRTMVSSLAKTGSELAAMGMLGMAEDFSALADETTKVKEAETAKQK